MFSSSNERKGCGDYCFEETFGKKAMFTQALEGRNNVACVLYEGCADFTFLNIRCSKMLVILCNHLLIGSEKIMHEMLTIHKSFII